MSMTGYAIAYGAAALIKAGSSYFSGQAAAGAQYRNAENAWNTALWNAQNTFNTGMFQTAIVGNSGRTNALQQALVATMNINDLKRVAEYNMDLQKQVTEYNTAMLMDELPQLAAQRDLNLLHIRQEGARTQGSLVAYQAASGTTIGTGANMDVLVDSKTQQLLDEQVVMLQHKWQVDAVFDAIAKNEWEGQMAIDKAAFDVNNQILGIKNNATLGAVTELSNSMRSMMSILNNTQNQMQSIYMQGSAQASTYESTGRAEATEGAIKAGGSLLSSAISYGSKAGWFDLPSGGDGTPNSAGFADVGKMLTGTPASAAGGFSQVPSMLTGTPSSARGGFSNVGSMLNWGF